MLDIETKELYNIFEAMLFASGEPVSIKKIAEVFEEDESKISEKLKEFADDYNYKRSGLRVIKMDDCYQICTGTEYFEYVRRLLLPSKYPDLSRAALEVLSVVAYNQPVIKSVIEQVRGVDCSGVINKLLSRDLIEERGRHNSPGRPIMYGTTREFLRSFGLSSLDDLPGVEALAEMANTEQMTISMD